MRPFPSFISTRADGLQLFLLWLLTLAAALLLRPVMPLDETRYLSVAWEMWLRGDFLVPHLNGEPYAHKPPLLFWLYQLGWWLFGVSDWWPRLVAPLFGLGSLVLTGLLARRLWPQEPAVAGMAPWLLFGTVFWTGYGTTAMFDMLVVFFTLAGLIGLRMAGDGESGGWRLLAVAIGLGLLAKGPVILLHLLPAALLGPWWSATASRHKGRWYLRLLGALFGGALVALAWALPAALRGGESYAHAIFWGQTADRMVDSFAHGRPFWWYLPLLPLVFFPWFWWKRAWKGVIALGKPPEGPVRFLIAWALPAFAALSAISGKQVHYLLPLFPAVALLTARGLSRTAAAEPAGLRPAAAVLALFGLLVASLRWWPVLPEWAGTLEWWWSLALPAVAFLLWRWKPRSLAVALKGGALASVLVVLCLHLTMRVPLATAYDLRPVARQIALLQERGVPLVHEGRYAGQYQFLGRLERPIAMRYRGSLPEWARRHPDGYIVFYLSRRERNLLPAGEHFWQFHRGRYVILVPTRYYLDRILPAGS